VQRPPGTGAHWRLMLESDLVQVNQIADIVHINYPEDEGVFAERRRLYPPGCQVLASDAQLFGYIISHPSIYARPPALNSLLGELPERPTTYYVHDIALLPEVRNQGHASRAVELVLAHATIAGFTNVSLIAVNNSTEFWRRHGFLTASEPSVDAKLESYGAGSFFMVRRLDK
jgi:GNAT superfamily N-acetyltransferase